MLAEPLGHDHEHGFDTWHYTTTDPLSESALEETIRTLPESVYRAKGVVRSAERPDERVVVQAVGRRVSTSTIGRGSSCAAARCS